VSIFFVFHRDTEICTRSLGPLRLGIFLERDFFITRFSSPLLLVWIPFPTLLSLHRFRKRPKEAMGAL